VGRKLTKHEEPLWLTLAKPTHDPSEQSRLNTNGPWPPRLCPTLVVGSFFMFCNSRSWNSQIEEKFSTRKNTLKNEPNPNNEHKRRQPASAQPLRAKVAAHHRPPTTHHPPPCNNEPILPSLGMNEQEVAHCNSRSGRNPLLRSPTTSSGCSRPTTVWSSARLTA
jgi:hypothetical protein